LNYARASLTAARQHRTAGPKTGSPALNRIHGLIIIFISARPVNFHTAIKSI